VSDIGPSIGFLETSSLAKGYEALDAMLKKAAVEPLMVAPVPRGKLIVMIGGPLAEVEQSMLAGLEIAGKTVVDQFTIQNVHQQLPAAIKGRVKVDAIEAIGLIETKEIASAIYAGDVAAKSAAVTLIEARNQPGGKGLVVMTGDVGAVRAAVAAGAATVKKDMLVAEVVIPFAHKGLLKQLQ
jgi:microcompartment protein CcmL/EutN